MKRAWYTIDRWGPIVVSVITLLGVAVLAWNYDRQLASRNATINGLQNQINILSDQTVKCKQGPDYTIRLEAIENRLSNNESDIKAFDAWMRNTRERLAEKGWKP